MSELIRDLEEKRKELAASRQVLEERCKYRESAANEFRFLHKKTLVRAREKFTVQSRESQIRNQDIFRAFREAQQSFLEREHQSAVTSEHLKRHILNFNQTAEKIYPEWQSEQLRYKECRVKELAREKIIVEKRRKAEYEYHAQNKELQRQMEKEKVELLEAQNRLEEDLMQRQHNFIEFSISTLKENEQDNDKYSVYKRGYTTNAEQDNKSASINFLNKQEENEHYMNIDFVKELEGNAEMEEGLSSDGPITMHASSDFPARESPAIDYSLFNANLGISEDYNFDTCEASRVPSGGSSPRIRGIETSTLQLNQNNQERDEKSNVSMSHFSGFDALPLTEEQRIDALTNSIYEIEQLAGMSTNLKEFDRAYEYAAEAMADMKFREKIHQVIPLYLPCCDESVMSNEPIDVRVIAGTVLYLIAIDAAVVLPRVAMNSQVSIEQIRQYHKCQDHHGGTIFEILYRHLDRLGSLKCISDDFGLKAFTDILVLKNESNSTREKVRYLLREMSSITDEGSMDSFNLK